MKEKKSICHDSNEIFKDIYNHLEQLEDDIGVLKNYLNITINDNLFLFLCKYDYIRNFLQEILSNFGLINKNFYQVLEIGLNQYLPKPVLSRSYSYKGIHEYLLTQLNIFLKNIGIEKNIEIVWDFKEHYKVSRFGYIESSFYHQDIPMNFSIYAHEIGHILLQEKKELSDFYGEYVRYSDKILLSDDFKGYDEYINIADICDEILCDLFGCSYFGDGYIFSYLSELAGSEFNISFLDDNGDFVYTEIGYNIKRDSLLVRFFVLADIIDDFFIDKELIYENKESIFFFKDFVSLHKSEFIKHYSIHDRLKKYARQHIDILEIISEQLSKFMQIDYNRKRITDFFTTTISKNAKNQLFSRDIFIKSWRTFIDNGTVDVDGFRKNLIKINNEHKQKVAVFGKLAINNINKDKIKSVYKKTKFLFGMYNFFTIKDGSDLDVLFRDIEYYETKQLLIELDKNSDVYIDTNKIFNLIVTIKIDDNCISENIDEFIQYKKTNFSQYHYTLYKTLGPKDMFCMFENLDLESLFDIKKTMADKFSRTHSFIYLSDTEESNKSINGFVVRVIARVNSKFKSSKYIKDFDIVITTGIFDYEFSLKGKEFDTYKVFELMQDENILDMQVKIDKKVGYDAKWYDN